MSLLSLYQLNLPLPISASGTVSFQAPALLANALEIFAGTSGETFQKPALSGATAEIFVATASEALKVAALSGTDSEIFAATAAVAFTVAALAGSNLQIFGGSAAINFKRPAVAANSGGDTYGSDFYGAGFYGVEDVDAVGPYGHHPILYLPRRHWQEAVIALYAAEAIDDDEFAALLAA